MPGKKTEKTETSVLKTLELDDQPKDQPTIDVPAVEELSELDRMRIELIKGSEDGDVKQSVSYIRKAPEKAIRKMRAAMTNSAQERSNEEMTDMIISNLAELLGGLDAISSPENLKRDLRNDSLFKKDITTGVSKILPLIPFAGIISGGARTGAHIGSHYVNKWQKPVTEDRKDDESPDADENFNDIDIIEGIKKITSQMVAEINDEKDT